jgi:hypothetical protein
MLFFRYTMDAEGDRLKRLVIVAGSVGVTALVGGTALMLGNWGFGQRQESMHAGRLERLLKRAPTREQVDIGLREEGARFLGSARTSAELERLSESHWTKPDNQAPAGHPEWSEARVYGTGRFVYVLYFDATGVLTGVALHRAPEPRS